MFIFWSFHTRFWRVGGPYELFCLVDEKYSLRRHRRTIFIQVDCRDDDVCYEPCEHNTRTLCVLVVTRAHARVYVRVSIITRLINPFVTVKYEIYTFLHDGGPLSSGRRAAVAACARSNLDPGVLKTDSVYGDNICRAAKCPFCKANLCNTSVLSRENPSRARRVETVENSVGNHRVRKPEMTIRRNGTRILFLLL